MLNSKKPLIFSIVKIRKSDLPIKSEKSQTEDSRDNKTRVAWSKQVKSY